LVWLPDRSKAQRVARSLNILAQINAGTKINPFLIQMLRTGDQKIKSKILGMITKSCSSPANVQRWLEDVDVRVRANVIESLGYGTSNEAWVKKTLRQSVHDSDNRTAANAIVGLCRLGEKKEAIAHVLRMASDERAPTRCSAAWAMGEMPIPELTETLHRMRLDPDGQVRWNALGALKRRHKQTP
jgi:HEAT repeat protein